MPAPGSAGRSIGCFAAGGLAGVAVGAGIAFVSGYAGEIAGQKARSVATGNGFKKMTSSMWLSAAGAGMINTVSFGLGALFQYADDGFRAMRESIRKYGVLKTAFSNSFVTGINDVYSAFTAGHTGIWGTANSYIWGNPNSRFYYISNYSYSNPYCVPMRGQPGYR